MQTNTRLQLSYVLAAIGGGLLIYAVLLWRELPHYSDDEIAGSVELNLSADLARLGSDQPPTSEQLDAMRKSIRSEVEAEIAQDSEAVRNWIVGGVALLVMALSQFLVQRYIARRTD